MGQAVSNRLAEETSRTRLEDSPLAPPFRKIFRSWNSTDLWTALRRYWNEFPRKEEWLTYADVTHILCLPDAECMFLWDAFANSGIEKMNRYAMFVAISMYAGCNVQEKGRFILTLFDTGMRGLISMNEFNYMIFVVLETLGAASQHVVKKRDILQDMERFFRVDLEEDLELSASFTSMIKTIDNTRQTLKEGWCLEEDKILGLVEMQEVWRYVAHIVDSTDHSFICPHHSAVENPKRVSPSMIMARGPSRNLATELVTNVEGDDDDGEAAWEGDGGDATGEATPGGTKKKSKESKAAREARLEWEKKADEERAAAEKERLRRENEWVHVTLSWEGAVTDNPWLRLKIQREISKCLGIAEKRVAITFCGMGVIHVAIRGDVTRSAYQLGFLLKSQIDSKLSSLRKGLLMECAMYSGLELIDKYAADAEADATVAVPDESETVPAPAES